MLLSLLDISVIKEKGTYELDSMYGSHESLDSVCVCVFIPIAESPEVLTLTLYSTVRGL